jgi:hypothetical protein
MNMRRKNRAPTFVRGVPDRSGAEQSQWRSGAARGQLKGYVCRNFDSALPTIASRTVVDLSRFSTDRKDFADRVLYTKSRYMEHTAPNLERRGSIEAGLVEKGVVDGDGNGPEVRAFKALLTGILKQ